MPIKSIQTDIARSPRHDRLYIRRNHKEEARALADPCQAQDGRGATILAGSPCGTAAAATSAAIVSSISSGNKEDCRAEVIAIEYDPNRSARIALLQY